MGEWKEECGVFGVWGHPRAAEITYLGLHSLQHRGQEGAGIASADGARIVCQKGKGLLSEVFPHGPQKPLSDGRHSIGHVRYATAGGDELENVQPMLVRARMGSIAVAHNGQIVNAPRLREMLEVQGSIFHSSSDSEIFLHLIQRGKGSLLEKLAGACLQLDGAFSAVILTEKSLYAVRDRFGFRPLSVAQLGEGYCVSSESCAYQAVGAKWLREVRPGEILKISSKGLESIEFCVPSEALCAMEYIYFSRPDSDIGGLNVHAVRKMSGRLLAARDHGNIEADLVMGVPDSSLSAAMGYSEVSGLPLEMGLVKNRYVGRTFIQPTKALRELGVRLKLSVNASVVAGKRVVLVDDSLVRGTTSRRIVELLKEAGAAAVHLRIASPKIFFHVATALTPRQRPS